MRRVTAIACVALDRACFDRDGVSVKVSDRLFDTARPNETEVAVTWFDRPSGIQAFKPWPVHRQLPSAEPVLTPPLTVGRNLGTKDASVERVRALPI